jgi:hypothetical protein
MIIVPSSEIKGSIEIITFWVSNYFQCLVMDIDMYESEKKAAKHGDYGGSSIYPIMYRNTLSIDEV